MIKEFNKITLETIRQHLNNNLEDSLENIIIDIGNCSYNSDNATFKLECRIKGTDTKEESNLKWVIKSGLYNLDLNRTHPKYKLVGYKAKARKRPFIIEDLINNKRYVINAEETHKMFGIEKITNTIIPFSVRKNEGNI